MKRFLSWSGGKDSSASIALSYDKEIVSQGFKYGRTFASVNREVQVLKNQISIFDEVKKNESNTL